jgi:hypothetical protein
MNPQEFRDFVATMERYGRSMRGYRLIVNISTESVVNIGNIVCLHPQEYILLPPRMVPAPPCA